MEMSTIISIIALVLTLIINIAMGAFWLGTVSVSLKDIKESVDKYQDDTKEHFKSLEEKQNKHNNLIERMVIVEQSTKSAHHRQDDCCKRVEMLERKINK